MSPVVVVVVGEGRGEGGGILDETMEPEIGAPETRKSLGWLVASHSYAPPPVPPIPWTPPLHCHGPLPV